MWKDTTSYRRGSAPRVPQTFRLYVHSVTITVSRHIHYPGTWVMLSDPLFSYNGTLDLETDDLVEAKQKAIAITLKTLTEQIESLSVAAEFLKSGIGNEEMPVSAINGTEKS